MKTFIKWLAISVGSGLLVLFLAAFAPDSSDFNANQFAVSGQNVSVKTGALSTNFSVALGLTNVDALFYTSNGFGILIFATSPASDGSIQISPMKSASYGIPTNLFAALGSSGKDSFILGSPPGMQGKGITFVRDSSFIGSQAGARGQYFDQAFIFGWGASPYATNQISVMAIGSYSAPTTNTATHSVYIGNNLNYAPGGGIYFSNFPAAMIPQIAYNTSIGDGIFEIQGTNVTEFGSAGIGTINYTPPQNDNVMTLADAILVRNSPDPAGAVPFGTSTVGISGWPSLTNDLEVLGANKSIKLSTVRWITGSGSPNNVVSAPVGSYFSRTDGGAGTTLYVKESGAGSSGWVGK